MNDLAKRECKPCEDKDFPPLTREQALDYLPHVPGCEMNTTATHVTRSFVFSDFKSAMAFAVEVGKLAEEDWHHPDLTIGWGRVAIDLSTHSISGLSENDFILAAKINLLLES
jgi:4a-hydroxytetrahydrobiopterin dehydratase